MELTMQDGALYAVQRTARNSTCRNRQEPPGENTTETLPLIRTSVGEFAMRSTQVGCYLELVTGEVNRVLGLYQTNEAALEALINRRTGFSTWDALGVGTAEAPVGRPEQ